MDIPSGRLRIFLFAFYVREQNYEAKKQNQKKINLTPNPKAVRLILPPSQNNI